MLKTLYRSLLPTGLRDRVARARERAGMIANYLLARSPSLGVAVRPGTLYIEGTNICNARCVFCAYPQMERPKATMPMELFQKVVDEYLALGLGEIDLTPIVGDPFVDTHLFERLDYLASRPEVRRFHFYTNAILLKPGYASRLMGYGERFWIFCSFGGFDRGTYHKVMGVDKFEAAVASIRELVETKVKTGSAVRLQVNLRVPKGNERGEFYDYLCRRRDEGVLGFDGVDDYDNWGGKIADAELRGAGLVPKPPPVHRGPCRRLLTGPVILADGRVNACACRDVEATLIIGDVSKQSLQEVLAGPELKNLLHRHERDDFPEICKSCTRYRSVWDDVRDE